MANYNWRLTNGDLGIAADWINTTTGENPATTVPGAADTANFNATGGTLTGSGTALSTSFAAGATAPWVLGGQYTSGAINVSSALNVSPGAKLTLLGRANSPSLPYGGNLNAPIVLTGAVFDSSAAQLNIGAPYAPIAQAGASVTVQGGSTFTTLGLSVGVGTTASLIVQGAGSTYASVQNTALDTATSFSGYLTIGQNFTSGTTTTPGTGTLTLTQGGTASADNGIYIGAVGQGSTGTANVGAGSTLTLKGGFLGVGTNTAGNGTLNVNAGGTVLSIAAANVASYTLGIGTTASSAAGPGATGAVNVSGIGALVDIGQNGISVGLGGTGFLTVSSGGTVRSGTTNSDNLSALAAARGPGSAATITVTGAGSSITAQGYVYIGRAGAGTLLVDQGGSFTGGGASVGGGTGVSNLTAIAIGDGTAGVNAFTGIANSPLYFGGTSAARIANGSVLHSLGNLNVGRRGTTGSLVVDTGSTVTADTETQIGSGTDRPGAAGTLAVQGGSILKTGGNVVTGLPGLRIGGDMGNTGTVTVTGTGSQIDSGSARITVGATGGTGMLNVLAGAKVTSGAGYVDTEAALALGAGTGATGTVMIGGAGSSLVAAGQAVLAGSNSGTGLTAGGIGTLSVTTGGLFRAASLASFSGGTLNMDGTSTAVIGTSVGIAGMLTVDAGAGVSGAGVIHATVRDNGSVIATGGSLAIDAVDSAGTGTLGVNGGTLLLGSAGGQALQFAGVGTIRLGALTGNGTVIGFAPGDALDFAPGLTSTFAGNVLTVRNGSTVVGTETFAGLAPATTLALVADGTGGQQVTAGNALFDPAFYLARNADVKAAGIDPLQHYLTSGYKEGRDPSAFFSTSYYLTNNPDVAAAGVNPLLHFEASGYIEGRNPSSAFSLSDYLAAYPDVKAAGLNPLLHYVNSGRAEGRSAFGVGPAPEPLFDAAYYYARNPDVRAAGLDAYAHYIASGYKEGRAPDTFFDAKFYLTQNADVAAAGVEPLAHFLSSGYKEGREPSLLFSDAKYLAANPDVKAAGLNPLAHYIASGRTEGRIAFLSGGSASADPLINAAYYDPQLGATLIPTGTAAAQQAAASYAAIGWQRGLNPDALFDTNYYLNHNPDVAAAHINPLLHFEVNGWREGRNPSAAFSDSKYLAAYADVKAAGIDPLLHYLQNGQAEGRTAFAV